MTLCLLFETLIGDFELREKIMHKCKLKCNEKIWHDNLKEMTKKYFDCILKVYFKNLEAIFEGHESLLSSFEDSVFKIIESKNRILGELDFDQIVVTFEKCIFAILEVSREFFEDKTINLRKISEGLNICALKRFYQIDNAETDVISSFLFYYENINEFKHLNLENNTINQSKNIFYINLNALFLNLLYYYSEYEFDKKEHKITQINSRIIVAKTTRFIEALKSLRIANFISLIPNFQGEDLKILIDFNENHLKLFVKLYLCQDKNIKSKLYSIIEEFNDIISSLKNHQGENIKYIIENNYKKNLIQSYLVSCHGSLMSETFKKNYDEIKNLLQKFKKHKNVYEGMKKFFGKEIVDFTFTGLKDLLMQIQNNIEKYQNCYAGYFLDKAKKIFTSCPAEFLELFCTNEKIIMFHSQLYTFCSYIYFLDLLITRERKEAYDWQKTQDITKIYRKEKKSEDKKIKELTRKEKKTRLEC